MTDYDVGRCERHGVDVPEVTKSYAEANGLPYGCQPCRDELANGPNPATMTGDERGAEVTRVLTEPCWAGFDAVWQRIDKLVGRSTWTHELADEKRLADEARSWSHPSDLNAHALHTLEQMAGEKPVIVANPEALR